MFPASSDSPTVRTTADPRARSPSSAPSGSRPSPTGSTGSARGGPLTIVIGARSSPAARVPPVASPLRAARQRRRGRDPRQHPLHELQRPRPYGVTIIGRWAGFSMPSLAGGGVRRVPHRRRVHARRRRPAAHRSRSGSSACWSRRSSASGCYLAVDHPSDVVVAVTLGVALPLARVPLLHPELGVPGRVQAGQDRGPRRRRPRGDAIRHAVQDQLGVGGPRGRATSASPVRADRPRSG